MTERFWWWLFSRSLDHFARFGARCANRHTRQFQIGRLAVTVEIRNTEESDGYERTELLRMLQTIRTHEKRQGWECPEPKAE